MSFLITGGQVRAARALLGLSRQSLANASQVHLDTVLRIEGAGGQPIRTTTKTLSQIVGALESRGIRFCEGGLIHQRARGEQL
jgi:hypothetical protein